MVWSGVNTGPISKAGVATKSEESDAFNIARCLRSRDILHLSLEKEIRVMEHSLCCVLECRWSLLSFERLQTQ
jgi:hypothetical protein